MIHLKVRKREERLWSWHLFSILCSEIEVPSRFSGMETCQKAVLDGVSRRQKRADEFQIDYSDIPIFTDKQFTEIRHPPKKLVAVRQDAIVVISQQQ